MNEIEKSWHHFLKKPFPEGIAGKEIEGIELAGLDSYSAGCIDTFIDNNGRLDQKRISVLQNCSKELDTVILHLDGEAKDYFEHLGNLAKQVLNAVS
jgi:hypothetical protein